MWNISRVCPRLLLSNNAPAGATPRSTVATTTEIYDYLRLLFARVGQPHCYICGKEIQTQHAGKIVDAIMKNDQGCRIQICAPLVRGQKGEHQEILRRIKRDGFVRVRIDGEVHEINDAPTPKKNNAHNIEAVVDRLAVKEAIRSRIADSVELALKQGDGSGADIEAAGR